MKTLEDLKAFSLDKKQMNEATGGANNGCDYVIGYANEHMDHWSDAEKDQWAGRIVCNELLIVQTLLYSEWGYNHFLIQIYKI